MKQSRKIAIVFSVVNLILLVVCGVFYFRADRTSPEFRFQVSDLIYKEEAGEEQLLLSITAFDKEDGDVTGRIVIEKIVKSEQENSVIVFYAVSDRAGNVAKISRVFPAQLCKTQETVTSDPRLAAANGIQGQKDEAMAADPGTAGMEGSNPEDADAAEDTDASREAQTAEEDSADPEDQAARQDPADPEDQAAQEDSVDRKDPSQEPSGDEAAADEAQETEEGGREQRPEPEAQPPAPSETDKGQKPVVTLKTAEVTTSAGAAPAWVDVIGSLSDDRDSYETLFYNLSISKYDVNKAGTYKVALTTKDSDGNKSDPVTLTIHVK